jgi:hypothetical protein
MQASATSELCARTWRKHPLKLLTSAQISIELLPADMADASPAGSGRSEPNMDPYCPPPNGRLTISMNPIVLCQTACMELFSEFPGLATGLCCCCCKCCPAWRHPEPCDYLDQPSPPLAPHHAQRCPHGPHHVLLLVRLHFGAERTGRQVLVRTRRFRRGPADGGRAETTEGDVIEIPGVAGSESPIGAPALAPAGAPTASGHAQALGSGVGPVRRECGESLVRSSVTSGGLVCHVARKTKIPGVGAGRGPCTAGVGVTWAVRLASRSSVSRERGQLAEC